ncbi:hypothetical protein JCGZ_12747 [Jatropha curcas]|uniref:Uncharacterized protein n=1 Tax=Jatropha curcas TaxID=180498 RepID=A0A067KLU6_JATCU|nr:hypothetical protein JCGZ_12747 [Jatropha curcas]
MALKKITVTSKATQTVTSNPLDLRSTTDLSPDVNIKTKPVAETQAKMTPQPQQSISEKDESAWKGFIPLKEMPSKETLEKGVKLTADGSILTIQPKELIKEALKDQLETTMQPSCTYSKPYASRIDMMKMPSNYQPPKFQ